MKLTKSDREAFTRAVMHDVPLVDYYEQIHELLTADIVSQLPPAIQACWKDNELRGYIKCDNYLYGRGGLAAVVTPPGCLSAGAEPERKRIADLNYAQDTMLNELEGKLTAVIGGCTTLKQAKERLPEFEKYLPAERDGTGATNLPAISGVVADLMRAGWPKGQEQAA